MKHEKSCGAVVYKNSDAGRLYLLEHMVQGHVSIPKGHVENDETEEQTALREIKEETDLDVRLDTGFRRVITYSPAAGITKDVVFFAAEALTGQMKNQECEVTALEWLGFEDACRALSFESDRETLRLADEYINALR